MRGVAAWAMRGRGAEGVEGDTRDDDPYRAEQSAIMPVKGWAMPHARFWTAMARRRFQVNRGHQ